MYLLHDFRVNLHLWVGRIRGRRTDVHITGFSCYSTSYHILGYTIITLVY